MNIYKNPDNGILKKLLERPKSHNTFEKEQLVGTILQAVKTQGDAALYQYAKDFDKVTLKSFLVGKNEIKAAVGQVSNSLKRAIKQAYKNIDKFHKAQKVELAQVETTTGVFCWRKQVAINKVGLYIPGGSAPLFSTVLMLGIPAKIAGCKNIILCTPPNNLGEIPPEILYTANLLGIDKIFKVGGAQAIAAMAFGTESIPQVYKIFGPGNSYVTLAKTLVQKEGIAIDMPAGPSELMVMCDATANSAFVASDLLSQAEHGIDSQVILLCTDCDFIKDVQLQLTTQLEQLPRKTIAQKALENSKLIYVDSKEIAIKIANYYAPEHLIVCGNDVQFYVDNIQNAGSVFIGDYSPESAGDYASGTNHTLPTSGYARVSGGVFLEAFVKNITFQKISKIGLKNLGKTIEIMAEAEGLQAHKNAISIRLKFLKNDI
ncbi:MAG: histidinol dehydrogenase [Flavobacteriaceae bacterium]|nr:histidinol dehydrogenase [Flavobacteriaceae bacterium]